MDLGWLLLVLVLVFATFGLIEVCARSKDPS